MALLPRNDKYRKRGLKIFSPFAKKKKKEGKSVDCGEKLNWINAIRQDWSIM